MSNTTILIADDHTLVREAWSFLLNSHPGFTVVGACGSAEAAIEQARTLRPQVVILDINLPGMNGIEAVGPIRKCSPASRILGVSMHALPTYARKMIQEGASGYLTKNSPRAEMIRAITEVLAGKKYICQEIKDALSEQIISNDRAKKTFQSLTGRELQIISRIVQGETSREIGEALGVTLKTVEVHRYNILRKLDLKSTTALIHFLHQHQLELIS